jgi:hypothetical protein
VQVLLRSALIEADREPLTTISSTGQMACKKAPAKITQIDNLTARNLNAP